MFFQLSAFITPLAQDKPTPNPDKKNIPTSENYEGRVSSISDRSCYDESKRSGETYTYIYKNFFSLDTKIIRPFNFYGNGMSKIDKSFTFLATVGSTAPFIGLFGTVWGIMNSFQSIAISRNTSLAIVAPGIAEALFATALGLLAAIPAVVAYNKFNSDSKKYLQKLENFSKRFLSII